MDVLPNPADMTDAALIEAWQRHSLDDADCDRTAALAAELQKRNVDF